MNQQTKFEQIKLQQEADSIFRLAGRKKDPGNQRILQEQF